MKRYQIFNFFLKPFTENIVLFLCLWLLASSADFFFWAIHGNPVFGTYMGVHGFIECYVVVLLWGILKGKAASITKVVLLVLGYINMAADAMVHDIMHFSFTGDLVAIIMGTNVSEAAEFTKMFLTNNVICFIIVVAAVSAAILMFGEFIVPVMEHWGAYCFMLFLVAGVSVVAVRKSNNWEGVFLNKIGLFLAYESPVDLRQYRTTPKVVVNGTQPGNIVVVIGESLSRNHCSLYGYEKQTQPCLEEMLQDSLIVRYDNVEAAYPNTVESFKSLMSTYKSSSPTENWYSSETFLFDVLKSSGYRTYWVSNQSSTGIYDNIVAKFAQLADSTVWVGTKGMGIGKHDYDELVLPIVKGLAGESGKKFIIVHLMGSHEGFESRYPQDYADFTAEDYPDRPENQRWTLAAYDNSILYNDFVVSSLMKMFLDSNSFVVYFPDHGLDIFDTDSEYAGHARTSDTNSFKAGITIPFISTKPDSMNIMQDAPFNTEDMFGFLLDVLKIEIIG